MIPTLIVLGLLALGVGIVAFATRRPATRQDVLVDQDTGWKDPVIPAAPAPVETDPFAHAPDLTPPTIVEPVQPRPLPVERAS
jgi:hypothetical protein